MKLENITTKDFKSCNFKVVVIPIGTIEAHGKHLPLGTDNIIPAKIVEFIEEEFKNEVLIAPLIPYGHAYYLEKWPGTINVSSDALRAYLLSVCKEFVRNGIKRFLFLNGHGGNTAAIAEISEIISYEGATSKMVNWWEDFNEKIKEIAPATGHAGEDETSLVLVINALLVDIKKAKAGPIWPHRHEISLECRKDILPEAITGDPTKASIDKGIMIYNIIKKEISDIIKTMMGDK
ncbi:MAG: creatininase family protein [Candidatus Methanofastidiosia archaeon]